MVSMVAINVDPGIYFRTLLNHVKTNVLMAGFDPVNLDYYAAKHIVFLHSQWQRGGPLWHLYGARRGEDTGANKRELS